MNQNKEVYDNSFGAGDNDSFDEVLQDDSASGDMWRNLPGFMGNECLPSEQFNENHRPKTRLSPLASSIPRVPSLNEEFQFNNLLLFNDSILYGNFDSRYRNSSNNLSEGQNFPRYQPSNNFEPLNRSLMIGGTSKEALPLQGLLKIPDMVRELDENDGNVEDIFNAMEEYAKCSPNECGMKLRKQAEIDPKREKRKEIRNIHAEKSNKKRPAKELFLRGTVCILYDDRISIMEEKKRLKQENEALRKRMEEHNSRPNPNGLPEQPPPDDSNGGNSGGDSSRREPGSGQPPSRNTQAGAFNGITFSNSQTSRDGSASDDLFVRTTSRMSVEKLLTFSPNVNCVSNSRDNIQSSLEKVYQDFLSEEHIDDDDDDECDDSSESSSEESDDSTKTNYGKSDCCSERDTNQRKGSRTKNGNRRTSYIEKKNNWRGDCTEEIDTAFLRGMKMNERETPDGSNHSSQMYNRESDDFRMKKDNARVRMYRSE